MKSSLVLSLACFHLLPAVLAGNKDDSGSSCCKFTLTSSGPVACPAGQLPDGQIRLNGSYPETTFCLGKDGGITDDHGRGCIVTEEPITQIQCDEGKAPVTGFSIGPNKNLLYKGSPSFFACPATDSEYNIYVAPNFGQAKCVPITLQASGDCGAEPPTSTCPAPPPPTTVTSVETDISTKWQTQVLTQTETETTTLLQTEMVTQIASSTVTSTFTQTSTITTTCTVTESVASTVSEVHTSVQVITSTLPCTSSTTGWNSTTTSPTSSTSVGCHKCTAGSNTTTKETGTGGGYPTGGTETDVTILPTITNEATARRRRGWGF